jgi:hypothetical protein
MLLQRFELRLTLGWGCRRSSSHQSFCARNAQRVGQPVDEHLKIIAGDDDNRVFVRPIRLPQDHVAVIVPVGIIGRRRFGPDRLGRRAKFEDSRADAKPDALGERRGWGRDHRVDSR